MIAGQTDVSSLRRAAPGPRAWPVLGNLGVFRGVLPFLDQQWKRHGDVFRVQMAGNAAMVVAHPELVQQILLTKRENFVKGHAYDTSRKLLGEGLLTLEGDAWKTRRSLAQPAFHKQSLEKLTDIMAQSGARFFERLAAKQGTADQVIDVHRLFVRLTLDVVIAALFGEGTLESDEISYESLSHVLEILSDNVNGFRLPDWIPTPGNIKFKRTSRELDVSVFSIIAQARKDHGSHGAGSLLEMLLGARDEDGAELSATDVRNEVLTLFIAGHETTALTLTWLFALLDRHPDVLARMRHEVDTVLSGRDPTFEDISKLSYLRQVFEETLRIRPVAPMIARNVVSDDQLGGFTVSRGDMVLPFIWGLHRHPDFWVQPERFDPDRFASGEGSKLRHKWSYLPFSGGPRVCIGNQFSLIESVVLLAQLFNRFDFEVQSCADVKPVAIGTLRPSRPVHVKFKARAR